MLVVEDETPVVVGVEDDCAVVVVVVEVADVRVVVVAVVAPITVADVDVVVVVVVAVVVAAIVVAVVVPITVADVDVVVVVGAAVVGDCCQHSSADWRLCSWQLEGWCNRTEEDSWRNPVDSGEIRQRHCKRPLTKHVEVKSLQTE
jgi:hypothetical protein